ncbi:Flagellar hook protein FlgE [Buchnera aphidicola (Eriosoma lanigerum)]|uniref:flagellar hook protein FlgE n=1 Tax=Buchnera aphidicola TaxID=9 RepID=UPI00346469E5
MSFSDSISGLTVAMNQINTIGNNIANATTNGFKSDRTYVHDMINQSNQNNNSINNGAGAALSRITQDYSPGTINKTGNNLDFYINNDGFFRLQDLNNSIYYTRNGEFHLDENQNLVNINGMYLTGYLQDKTSPEKKLKKDAEIINFKKFYQIPAKKTTNVDLKITFDKKELSHLDAFVKDDPNTYNHKTNMILFDEKLQPHIIGIYWKKNFSTVWTIHMFDETDNNKKLTSFFLEFYTEGPLMANPPQFVTIQSDDFKTSEVKINFVDCIQEDQPTDFSVPMQNGCRPGELYSYNILENGNIIGYYTNEQSDLIGKIAITNFSNLDALTKKDDNLWFINKNYNSKFVSMTDNNQENCLTIGALENSNVNINNELTNLITAQKNYQSISQSIQVQNQLLETLLNDLR